MNVVKTENALIKSTMLGVEDHGIMSFFLHLDFGGSGQGAGGYALDTPIHDNGKFIKRVGTACGMSLIMEILDVVGVDSWEKLSGKYIRTKHDHNGVYEIGNIIQDKWLNFQNFFNDNKGLT